MHPYHVEHIARQRQEALAAEADNYRMARSSRRSRRRRGAFAVQPRHHRAREGLLALSA